MRRGRLGQRSFGGYSGSPKSWTVGLLVLPSCYVFLLLLNSRFDVYDDESNFYMLPRLFFQCNAMLKLK